MKTPAAPLSQTSDSQIEAAVAHASLPALMMSMIHMTGDTSLLDGPARPKHALMFDMDAGMSPEDAASIRERAVVLIREYLAKGEPACAPLATETVERMLAFALAEQEIEPEARGFLLEELSLHGSDPRRVDIDPRAVEKRGASC